MTRDEVLAMQPGETLDSWVAEKVMGYEPGTATLGEWHPSTDISAAWEVFERLIATHPDTTLTHPWFIAADYRSNMDGEGNSGWRIQAEGDTAPEAICKASLLSLIEEDTP